MQDLERLTQLVENHLDSSVKLTRSKQDMYGDYVVFCFQSSVTGEHRFIKLIPQDNGELLGVISPIYTNSPHEKPESEWYERELVSIDRWFAHIIPTLFPVETVETAPIQGPSYLEYRKEYLKRFDTYLTNNYEYSGEGTYIPQTYWLSKSPTDFNLYLKSEIEANWQATATLLP